MDFKVIENGQVIECKSILEFKDESNDKNYIVYKENGSHEIFASRYIVVDNQIILEPIETQYEWNMIDNMLESRGSLDEKN